MSRLKLDEFGDRMIKIVPKLKIELGQYENSTLTRRDITTTQLLVLECLATCGHCKMHTLVDALKVKFSAVTAIIDRLVKTGFVIREHGKEDRRTVFVSLSAKGRKVLLEVYQQRRKAFMQVFSRVSAKERGEYLTILEKLVDRFTYKTFNVLVLVLCLGLLAGCNPKQNAPMQPPTPEVGVMTVSSQTLPITTELPGRIDAVRVAQVRARATGILLKRMFNEGSEVKEGDVLFQIDSAPLQANYDSAKAGFAKARAALTQTQAKADRYKALVTINAVSKQDYDDALAGALQAKADLEAAKASVETAVLNLGYANVTAPISGKIGEAKVTEGALVSQSDATQLAVIQQLDPIYFDFTQSSTDVLRLRRSFDDGQLQKVAPDEAKVTLLLEDGTTYQHPGKLLFSDITVDPSTGMITLRAQFPNPDHILLPGMFARVQLEQAVAQDAISVPQRAVALGANGSATVMIVTADEKAEARTIKLGVATEDKWTVTDGLKAGDTVIVEGLQKVRPGATVKTVPFSTSEDK